MFPYPYPMHQPSDDPFQHVVILNPMGPSGGRSVWWRMTALQERDAGVFCAMGIPVP